jgi:hypothetical protein
MNYDFENTGCPDAAELFLRGVYPHERKDMILRLCFRMTIIFIGRFLFDGSSFSLTLC